MWRNYSQTTKKLELRSQIDIELHVEVIQKSKSNKNRKQKYKFFDFDTHKNEIIEEFKIVEYMDLEDLFIRMELTYIENE